jgi:hypothetical protein
VRFVDSRSDARVQIADFLAGVARRIASDDLNGRGDVRLTGLLESFVDAESVWDGGGLGRWRGSGSPADR